MRFWILATLVCANAYVWLIPAPQALSVSFFDVGEGDAAFIEGPTGAHILIDGGPSSGATLRGIGARVPFFVRSLDAVIETTPTASYAAGLVGVFLRYRAKSFFIPPFSGDTKTADAVSKAAADSGAMSITLSRGMRILLGGGAFIDVLSPESDSTDALVLRLVYGNSSFLFTSAAPAKTETALAARYATALESDVLKAGGHGAKSASSAAFASAVSPRYVIFSRGCDNRFNHPAPEVVSRFRALGSEIRDTCTDGDITFRSDGTAFTLAD